MRAPTLFLTHPLTNIIKCFCSSESSSASVKTVRGVLLTSSAEPQRPLMKMVAMLCFFLRASSERSRSSALKNHTTSPELLIDTQAALFFQEKADHRGFEASPAKSPFPCSFPPHPLLCRMPCTVTNLFSSQSNPPPILS